MIQMSSSAVLLLLILLFSLLLGIKIYLAIKASKKHQQRRIKYYKSDKDE